MDRVPLEAHRLRRDDRAGIEEEFVQPSLNGAPTVAVVARPTGPARPVAWVLASSFSAEQTHLSHLEVVVARTLASAGYPVVRYHDHGYGDSTRTEPDRGLGAHLAQARDAVAIAASLDGVRTVGTMGALLGGAVAALVAQSEGLPLFTAWEPVVDGAAAMRVLLRSQVLHRWGAGEGISEAPGTAEVSAASLARDLQARGQVDIRGFPLTRQAYDEIAAMHLLGDLTSFQGEAMVLGLSRSGRPRPALADLAAHLERLGARCRLIALRETAAPALGLWHLRIRPGEAGRSDLHFDLNRVVAAEVVRWADEAAAHLEREGRVPCAGPSGKRAPANGCHGGALALGAPSAHNVRGGDAAAEEHPVFVPWGGERLAATLTLPPGPPGGLAILLTGLGGPRSHRHQLWTRLARRLADLGVASMRMDFLGLGDSTGEIRVQRFDLPLEDQVAAVVRFGRRVVGPVPLISIGNCWGGLIALRFGQIDPSCAGLVVIRGGVSDLDMNLRPGRGPAARAATLAGRLPGGDRLALALRRRSTSSLSASEAYAPEAVATSTRPTPT